MHPRLYRVGNCLVDLERRRVWANGSQLSLTWRTFEAFRLLIEANGQVVEKETLFQQLWPGVTVEESSLAKCIGQLRKALKDGEGADACVETVPRVGYRLATPAMPAMPEEPGGKPLPTATRGVVQVIRRRLAWVLAGGAAAAALGGWAGWRWWTHRQVLAEAEALYQEGRRWRRQADPESLQAAIESFRRAAQLNPRSPAYFASLAEALGRVSSIESKDRMLLREAAERAVELDANCAGCRAILGFTLFSRFWEWESAQRHLSEALRLAPKDSGLRGYWAMYSATQGRLDEALSHIETGIQIEPYHATLHQIKAVILCGLRRYPEAVAAADRALSIRPKSRGAWDGRAHALLLDGREQEALTSYLKMGWEAYAQEVDALYRSGGLAAALGKLLDVTSGSTQQGEVHRRAQWKMHLGDHAGALEELETAYRYRHFNLMYLGVDPVFDPIRAHPRFQRILADMKLPAAAFRHTHREAAPADRASR
jgi:DNA-binding winged helix-turn-helix (wHTH) protein